MLANLFKMSCRALRRDRLYSLINIAGLALAVFSCVILGLYLHAELSYDRHHAQHERIFRVVNAYEDYDTGNQRREVAITSPALGPMLARDFPEIASFVRLRPTDATLLRHEDRADYWERVFHADPAVFSVFTHQVVAGDPRTALEDPFAIAISASVAQAYFGGADALGATFVLGDGSTRTVTLVFADLPDNTHLKYDVLLSYRNPALAVSEDPRQLFGVNTYTYLLMPPGYEAEQFSSIASTFFARHMEALSREATNRAWRGWLQPLASIHLGEQLLNDEPTGNRYHLYGFAGVVAFILLMAAINYTNLTTALFARRLKSVGVRKLLGESRAQLVAHFLWEATLLMLVALVVGVFAVELALNETSLPALFGRLLTLEQGVGPAAVLLGTGLLFALLAGLYPAFYLSSFRPLSALAGMRTQAGTGTVRLREALLFVQFTIASAVVACTLLLVLQMRFVGSQPLGFAQNDRVVITVRETADIARLPLLQEELTRDTRIAGVTYASSMLDQEVSVNSTEIDTNDGTRQPVQLGHMAVAPNFLAVMGMQLAAGRDFAAEFPTDATNGILVNQALVDYMQWEQPLGKTLRSTWGTEGTVIGVVENFNFRSLHTAVEPFFLYQSGFSTPQRLGNERELVVQLGGEDPAGALAFVESTLRRFNPEQPFEYRYLDEALAERYMPEQRLMTLIGLFAGICIVITCLGVLGLATFSTERRRKEIGVRRVLGAEHIQVLLALFGRTLALALAGTCLAALLVWPLMDRWLDGFAYRITIEPAAFVAAAAAVLGLTAGTMAAQALWLGNLRPVLALRYE